MKPPGGARPEGQRLVPLEKKGELSRLLQLFEHIEGVIQVPARDDGAVVPQQHGVVSLSDETRPRGQLRVPGWKLRHDRKHSHAHCVVRGQWGECIGFVDVPKAGHRC